MSEGQVREEDGGGAARGRPGVCRSCGAITGPGEASCHMCGAPLRVAGGGPHGGGADGGGDPLRHADPETRRFMRAIIARPATFTLVFITLCIFLFLLMMMSGVQRDPSVLVAYGAKLNRLIDERGEWWRFVTPIFLHGGPVIGPLHLLMNMYGLFVLGPYVEKLYGSARFVFFWVLAGVGGVAASYFSVRPGMSGTWWGRALFSDFDVPSVGASGALFGLVGVLFVFGIKFRRELPEGFRRMFGLGILPIFIFNLGLGLALPYVMRGVPVRIDNAAHLGGFLSGVLLALFVGYKRPGERGPVAVAWHALQLATLALVVVSFGAVARNYDGPAPELETLRRAGVSGPTSLETYLGALNETGAAFNAALGGDGSAAERVTESLDKAPPLGEKEAALRAELKTLLAGAREFGARDEAERNSQRGVERRNELVAGVNSWQERYGEWVNAEGAGYGIIPSAAGPPQGGATEEKK